MEIPEPKPADLKPGTWLVWHFTTFRLSYLAGGDEFVPVNTRRAIDRDARKAIVKADLAMYRQFPKVPRGSFASRSLTRLSSLLRGRSPSRWPWPRRPTVLPSGPRSEEHTSELQS